MKSYKLYFINTFILSLALFMSIQPVLAQMGQQMKPTPVRGANEGEGQFDKLVIWGAYVLDGTGAPASGPQNIVIEKNKITQITRANMNQRPEGDKVIDARYKYVTPGFIDTHDHIGGDKIDYNASYAYKLWLAHGITSVRVMAGVENMLEEKKLSNENKIVAPRLVIGSNWGSGKEWANRKIRTPNDMKEWVQYAKKKGIEFIGETGAPDPEMMEALLSEANKQGIPVMAHLAQSGVVRMTAADAIKLGLDEVTHFYGIMESMLDQRSIQKWPVHYNYSNEYHRFSRVARLADESADPGSEKWNNLIDLSLKHNVIYSPTMSIYIAGRNPMAARNADWHFDYTLPSLWKYLEPNPINHGSFFFHWTSADEAAWHRFVNKWQKFIRDYTKAGGRITLGSDTAFIYQNFGFGYVLEMKLMQEAGLTPFEVLRAATLNGAEQIFQPEKSTGKPIEYGIIREGKLADLLIFTVNPLVDFNLIYGTGALRLDESTGETYRARALEYTIKDGVIYDVTELLKDVKKMVDDAKRTEGYEVQISPDLPMLAPVDKLSESKIPVE